jgi:hypothetical protein
MICNQPECDRSFTRSDALAKHMRTVHETEALRPSDPVPKHHSSNPQNKHQKLRLTFKAIGNGNGPSSDAGKTSSVPASPMTGPSTAQGIVDEDYEHNNVVYVPFSSEEDGVAATGGAEYVRQFPGDIHFSDEELALSPEELYKVLRMQLKWASEDGEELRREVLDLDEKRKMEWTSKELTLENLMESEAVGMERRGPQGPEDEAMIRLLGEDVGGLELSGMEVPWWRLPRRAVVDRGGGTVMEGIEGGERLQVA